MDDEVQTKLRSNGRRFQTALERIVEKYSKLQYEDDAIEVDLDNTCLDTLEHYITLSRKNLDKMDTTTSADLREESLQGPTKDSVLDYTCEERSGDFKTNNFTECHFMQNDATRYTLNPMDESQRNYTLLSDQPEDQDEELEVSLQSQGSSLGERYPDMVSQLGKAWHRQHVSIAAESVRRRYRRWLKSARMHRTNSSHVDQRCRKREGFNMQQHTLKSPVKSGSPMVAVSPSPVKIVTVKRQKAHYSSPVRSKDSAVVMDMPGIYEESSRVHNRTFTVSEPSLLFYTFTTSPPRSCHSPIKQNQDISLRMKHSPRPMHTAHSSVHGSTLPKEIYSSPVRKSPYKAKTSKGCFSECSDIYGSPTRRSPFKLHINRESPQPSIYGHGTSPTSQYMKQSFFRGLKKSAAKMAPSPSKLTVLRSTSEYPKQRDSFQQWSPQMSRPRRLHCGLRRHLSFDSITQPANHPSYSNRDFDDYFVKLYHKLVCLSKSSLLNTHPCRLCTKNSDTSRGHSNLAALALSPHRPLLRKRHGDLPSYPLSKRFRDGHALIEY